MLIGALISTVVIYVVIVAAAALLQRKLIYYPSVLTPAVAERDAADVGLVAWRNGRGEIIGWKISATGARTANVLILHGNAGSATDRDYLARPIHDAGAADVYILEYPGYGSRPGSPSIASLLAAAEEGFALLPTHEPVYLVGESLGTGVATYLASAQGSRVAGLALFMPYDNLASVAQSAMPFIPASLVLRERFTPDKWLAEYRGPIKIVLAGNDRVIPTRFGQHLFDGYAGPKELQIVPGAGHNDVAGQSAVWWKAVFAFWDRHATTRITPGP